MSDKKWVPNDFHYEKLDSEFRGVSFVQEVLKKSGIELGTEVLTSRDSKVQNAQALLKEIERKEVYMPEGIDKWQLPILFPNDKPTFLFITVGAPNSIVPMHAHKELSIFRFIVSGSIIYNDIELRQGDWMFVPGKTGYSYSVGNMGATILHKYVGL